MGLSDFLKVKSMQRKMIKSRDKNSVLHLPVYFFLASLAARTADRGPYSLHALSISQYRRSETVTIDQCAIGTVVDLV